MNSKQKSIENFLPQDQSKISSHIVFSGDIYSSLLQLEDNTIDCAITSPPYWNQRDYGFKGQIGNEKNLEDYIIKLTYVFNVMKNKMKNEGVFYLNIGDKYISKYGNTPLGMIPFKLALSMMKDGWILQDILIWYKPNHMPSGVKNRFTNTYEPVFVFVKNEKNFYLQYYNSSDYSNYIIATLQQNRYKHVATFPESLISNLLKISNLNTSAIILDPFAGSGTTAFTVKNYNELHTKSFNSISIEAKDEFVDIIKERCNISEESILKINFSPIENVVKRNTLSDPLFSNKILIENFKEVNYSSANLHIISVKAIKNTDFFEKINQDEFDNSLDEEGLLFILIPYLEPNFLVNLSTSNKWIIRNILLKYSDNLCYPIIMLVKDTKLVHYRFNLDNLRQEHLGPSTKWQKKDFLQSKVIKSTTIFKNPDEGLITNILSYFNNNFPREVQVTWSDNKKETFFVINFLDVDDLVEFFCPFCNTKLITFFLNRKKLNCFNCKKELWKDSSSIPRLKINKLISEAGDNDSSNNSIELNIEKNSLQSQDKKNIYKGKYSLEDKVNRGQSPGARLSVTEQYFFVTRVFNIKHGLFARYLNLFIKNIKISKTELQSLFPESYKHTIGHWFRYDMGGSLPKIEDLELLEELLNSKLNSEYKKLVTFCCLKFQSVLNSKQGKNPGDFIELSDQEIVNYFSKLTK